jgi:hypothetical protein
MIVNRSLEATLTIDDYSVDFLTPYRMIHEIDPLLYSNLDI